RTLACALHMSALLLTKRILRQFGVYLRSVWAIYDDVLLCALGGGHENAICKICSRCPRRSAGAWLYWYDSQTRRCRRALQGSDRCLAQSNGEIQRLQGRGARPLLVDRRLRPLRRRENGRSHALPQGRHGRALRQSNDPGRARPNEAKRPALRTRGQRVAVGGG